ncbi:BatA and WFA domain-containing protein [soil metagenome]
MPAFTSLFISPWSLAFLGLLPLVVVMYLLKLKRRPQVIASTLLWRRALQDLVANAPFQKLRNNILLWLQLLLLLLLILALARPVLKLSGVGGESFIVLLDLSASMQTKEDDGVTRIEKAKRIAMDAIENMRSGSGFLGSLGARDEMMIIGFADKTFPIQSMTSDKGALRNAINAADPFDTETDMRDAGYILKEKAMMQEGGALVPNPRAHVIIISDGRVGPSAAALADLTNVDFSLVGKTDDNVGFVGVDVRENFSGSVEHQIFASLLNASKTTQKVYVDLQAGGERLDVKEVEIEPQATASVVFSTAEKLEGLATLSLSDHVDAFALDDRVQFLVSPQSEMRVRLVTRGNPFIQSVFEHDPRVKLEVVRPTDYHPSPDFDMVVFDSYTPPDLDTGNFVFINAIPPAEVGYTLDAAELKNPVIIDWSRVSPITRFANFDRVVIGVSHVMKSPAGSVPLLQAKETDLISLQETESRRVLVINFDLFHSYWPLDVSFPIFFSNLIDAWGRSGRTGVKPIYPTGATIALVPPTDASGATITKPGGEKIQYQLEGKNVLYVTDTQKAGVYTAVFGKDAPRQLAVNLLSPLESNIAPQEQIEIGSRKISGVEGGVRSRREIWPWLLLAGLALLLIEWAIYCRRTFM